MTPHYTDDAVTLHHGDCLDVLRGMPDSSVDAIVTDPPYGLSKEPDMVEVMRHWLAGDDYTHRGAGFMGKSWDSFVPGPTIWRECFRVLKPGGHLLAFAGSRTQDLMGLAVRLAGFEMRDSITWMYGCHDDRTEVLTRRGWVNGLDLRDNDDVAQWATDGTVSLARPTARQQYPYDGRMVRFRNADVDQLVTPNHRVYRQVSGRVQVKGVRRAAWLDWQVDEAGAINRWERMRLPAAGIHNGPGIGGTDYAALLGWVWTEGGFDLTGTGVRVYQSSVNQPYVNEIAALLDRLGPHKRYDYPRTYTRRNGQAHPHTATTWYVSGDLARRVRTDLPGKTPTWDLLWRMTANEKRALWDAAMKGDGSKGQRTFWQKDRATLEWVQALLAGIACRGKVADDPRGALHWTDRPTVELQQRHLADDGEDYTGEVWCVTVPAGAFLIRRNGRVSVSGNSGFPKSLDVSKAIDKVRAEDRKPIDAVRAWLNDQRLSAGISHDSVNKHFGHASNGGGSSSAWMTNPTSRALPTWEQWAILKSLFGFDEGMDTEVWRLNGRKGTPSDNFSAREVLAERIVEVKGGTWAEQVNHGMYKVGERTIRDTAPATPDAATWAGWGTALKPAQEPIIVARKPLGAGTVAGNVLRYGTGALNIDATRVAHGADVDTSRQQRQSADTAGMHGLGDSGFKADHTQSLYAAGGRFPANVVLSHTEWCVEVGTRQVRTGTAVNRNRTPDNDRATYAAYSMGNERGGDVSYGTDGTETVAAWDCPEGCPVRELDAQSGVRQAGSSRKDRGTGGIWSAGDGTPCGPQYGDTGGASRFFPTFRYEAKAPTFERPKYVDDDGVSQAHSTVKPLDLMRWLVRLVTPPSGTVLDLFAGSGTTGEACIVEGFKCVLVEREADYLPLIVARLSKPIQPDLFGGAG